jgi:hypothetical protein
MRLMAGTVLALAAVATTAWAAPGETAYVGTTDTGVKVKLVVADSGNATAFKIAKTQATCDQGRLDTEAATFRRFDSSDPGEFSDKRRSKSTQPNGYLLKDTYRLAGTASADGTSWSGTYKKITRVYRKRHKVDTCVLNTTWDVQ